MDSQTSTLKRRLLGLLLLALVIGFVAITVLQYKQVFTKTATIYLETDSAGNSLPVRADVKIRGVLVGTVVSQEARDNTVVLKLEIKPDQMHNISANTTARLLPKTLFGERFVALQLPSDSTAPMVEIKAGGTIVQDSSGNAVQIDEMLDKLLPILQAVPPQDLSVTLTSINNMLEGRGESIGEHLVQLSDIVTAVGDRLPDVQADLRGLAEFSRVYATAAPDLIDALDNLRTTNATIVERQTDIRALLLSATDTAALSADLLDNTRESFIRVSAQSVRPLQVFADASPAFQCTFSSFADVEVNARDIVGWQDPNPGIRVSLSFVNPKGRYLPNQDEPRLFDTRKSKCYPLAQPGVPYPIPDGSLNDGSYQPPTTNPGEAQRLYPPLPQYSTVPQVGIAGSQLEQDALADVYSGATGESQSSIPGWTTLIGAPSLRGNEVEFK
ncbi:MCE family protein [Tomitella biformata]|uniref:MCE family protein n=1 Tax=Tomitella biformata TaxID=630403 RepID=UPI000467DA9D|nr:MCE family protein [Tomitella biformata]